MLPRAFRIVYGSLSVAYYPLVPISLLYVSGGGMNCVSCDICVYHLRFVFFPWGIPQLQSDWSLSGDNVRTTATITIA